VTVFQYLPDSSQKNTIFTAKYDLPQSKEKMFRKEKPPLLAAAKSSA
jgi:hypothetical protein